MSGNTIFGTINLVIFLLVPVTTIFYYNSNHSLNNHNNLAYITMDNANSLELNAFSEFERNIIQITKNNGDDHNPSLFKDNLGRLWVVWGNGSGINGVIWATYASKPYGNWEKPFKITDDLADNWNPVGLKDNFGILWIFWQSNRDGDYDIWYKNSSDNGRTWSQDYQLTHQSTNEFRPRVILDSSNSIWVFYETQIGENKEIVYQKTNTNSTTWNQQQTITISNGSIQKQLSDCCISDDGIFYLFVQELRNRWGTFIWVSLDSGQSWSKYQVTHHDNSGWGSVFTIDQNIFIMYEREMNLYLVESSNLEQDWSSEISLTTTDSNRHPRCYIDSNETVYTVWTSNRDGDWEIYLKIITFNKTTEDSEFQINFIPPWLPMLSFFVLGLTVLFSSGIVIFKHVFNDDKKKVRIQIDYTVIHRLLSLFFILFGKVFVEPAIRRLSPSKIKENDVRMLILEFLEEHDFLHFRELQRITKTGTAQLRWHLRVLKDFGFIEEIRYGQYLIYHLAEKTPKDEYIRVYFSLISESSVKMVLAFLEVNTWYINDLGDHLNIPRTTISYNCEKLLGFGILMKNDDDQLFLNSEYEIWIKKVVKKDR